MNSVSSSFSESWLVTSGLSRCNSTESIYSIQGKETDVVQDTPDTESYSEEDLEYEPVTETEDELSAAPVLDSTDQSDGEIIKTKVIEVSFGDEWDRGLADAEETSDGRDSELEPHDYWRCAQCGAANNNPLYRLCERCFRVRKNLFPPRPKRKHKRKHSQECIPRTLSQDSGVESLACHSSQNLSQPSQSLSQPSQSLSQPSQGLSQPTTSSQQSEPDATQQTTNDEKNASCSQPDPASENVLNKIIEDTAYLKRRAVSADRKNKRMRIDYSDSESDSDSIDSKKSGRVDVSPLTKTVSAPTLTIDSVDSLNSKSISNNRRRKESENGDNMCIVCVSEPKSGVFVHGRIAHICCCYKCAMKVWAKAKRCPVCNCRVSNVLKAVVM